MKCEKVMVSVKWMDVNIIDIKVFLAFNLRSKEDKFHGPDFGTRNHWRFEIQMFQGKLDYLPWEMQIFPDSPEQSYSCECCLLSKRKIRITPSSQSI